METLGIIALWALPSLGAVLMGLWALKRDSRCLDDREIRRHRRFCQALSGKESA